MRHVSGRIGPARRALDTIAPPRRLSAQRHVLAWFGLTAPLVCLLSVAPAALAGNLSRDTEPASLYGVHEVTLIARHLPDNPFSAECRVSFARPGGTPIAVDAFFDGDRTYRARTYVDETGAWRWTAACDSLGIDDSRGSFTARASALRGKLRPHRDDPRQWMTDDGSWFLNLSDTGYRLFNASVDESDFRAYAADIEDLGFTSVRIAALGGWKWVREARYDGHDVSNWPWLGEDQSRFDLRRFQVTDRRLEYLGDHHPDLRVQLILFGLIKWNSQENLRAWRALGRAGQRRLVRYMIARWAAFPQVFWLLVNDLHVGADYPDNMKFARESGRLVAASDPWNNLLAVGPAREQPYPFVARRDREWSTYIHIETNYQVSAGYARRYADVPQHVFNAEDRYEQDYPARDPRDADYFYRRLFWSWLLSGGSANYGGRHIKVQPYTASRTNATQLRDHLYTTPLRGADHIAVVRDFFARHALSLTGWHDADPLAMPPGMRPAELWRDSRRTQCMVAADGSGILVYAPNAAPGIVEEDGLAMSGRFMHPRREARARVALDLREQGGEYRGVWLRPRDGHERPAAVLQGGRRHKLLAPWRGEDALLYLYRNAQP